MTGAVYALTAVGLTLVYGVLHIINFAHGAILTAAMLPLLYFADKVTYTLAKRRDQPVAEPGPDGWLGFKR